MRSEKWRTMVSRNQYPQFSKPGRHNKLPLRPNKPKSKKTNKNQTKPNSTHNNNNNNAGVGVGVAAGATTPSQQLSFFLAQYQFTNRIQLSSLELESFKGISYLFIFLNWPFFFFLFLGLVISCLRLVIYDPCI